ncbi:MAG: phosphate signaling complex protein PhoU [Ruminococcus sp.]|nr:phosphate signaling complex protein PhoU [Ruminococcus sp.]MCD7726741.1 phosphate signaling complex protein PhoU [Ruminococcus sp.]MCD7772984.1 phosphate signaling complex protein PhoU [Ruminococcus sp.]
MREKFDMQMDDISLKVVKMATKVERIIAMSTKALQEKNKELANQAIALDEEINEAESEIQRLCINIMLMQQPIFADNLRFVSSAFKILTDLERMGDQARDISVLNLELIDKEGVWNIELISKMAENAAKMVSLSVVSYTDKDIEIAKQVIKADDEVDEMFDEVKNQLVKYIVSSENESKGIDALDTLMIAKYFERIADHAQNVAEWVIYSITGQGKDEIVL